MSPIDKLLDASGDEDEASSIGVDVDEEELIGSDTELNAPTVTKKSRKITATSTWEHSRPPKDGEPKRRNGALIFYCKHNVKDKPTIKCQYNVTGTTSIRRHLRVDHDIIVEAGERKITAPSNKKLADLCKKYNISEEVIRTEVLKAVLDKRVLNEALVDLIVSNNLPFRAVEWPQIHTLLKAANPAIDREVISSHSEVSTKIHSLFDFSKGVVRKRLQLALSKIHFSLDLWTSPNKNLFLAICAHFVDSNSQTLRKSLLGLRPVISHAGAEQATLLMSILQDFKITHKVGYIMGDNHGSNDTLCRSLKMHLSKERINWDPVHHRLRCIGHVLNLAVQDFLFGDTKVSEIGRGEEEEAAEEEEAEEAEEEEPRAQKPGGKAAWRRLGTLGKLHNIAVFIRSSIPRYCDFKATVGRGLPLDNSTRWNSWYQMLEVAIEKNVAIDNFCKKYFSELKDDYLTPEDWIFLGDTAKFLKPFQRATLATEGDKATIDRVLWVMDVIAKHYEKSQVTITLHISLFIVYTLTVQALYRADSSRASMMTQIKRSYIKFEKYYKKMQENSAYAAAIILHPNRKTKYIEKNWSRDTQRSAIRGAKELWEKYRMSDAASLSSDDSDMDVSSLADKLDDFDLAAKDVDLDFSNKDEYRAYLSQGNIKTTESALDWWLLDAQRQTWPRLSQMAIDLLSIPAMSDEPSSQAREEQYPGRELSSGARLLRGLSA
jgi:hAT family C-terminal dimerisation region